MIVQTEALQAPVAFFVFRRPDTTRRVFEAIAQARPSRLLLIADGPRDGRAGEAESCEEFRKIVTQVNWPCEVITNFADRNLGCGEQVFDHPGAVSYWTRVFDGMHDGTGPDTWDYQWFYSRLKNNSLNIIPRVNLMSNIGFGASATHTMEPEPRVMPASTVIDFPLRHPSSFIPLRSFDRRVLNLNLESFLRRTSGRIRRLARTPH
jgi:hypothetical protein